MNKHTNYKFFIAPSLKEGALFFCFFLTFFLYSQNNNYWFFLQLNDSVKIKLPVNFNQTTIQIPSYPKAISYTAELNQIKDSISFSLPVYENKALLKKLNTHQFLGIWIKYSGKKQYSLSCKIDKLNHSPNINLSLMKSFPSKWKFKIQSGKNTYTAVGIFNSYNDFQFPYLSGSIATPYGDLGNLNGYIQQDTLYLSIFNGSFATQVVGKIFHTQKIDSIKGYIYYGNWGMEQFTALTDNQTELKSEIPVEEIFSDKKFILSHQWTDIDEKPVIIEKDKPVIILIMGSWCPNCTDENKFFTEQYPSIKNHFQVIALSVERTFDKPRAINLLKKYRDKLHIPYPIVLLSEKSNNPPFDIFPELVKIPAFPCTIYFNKPHQPVIATTGFNGPATQELYEQTKQHILNILQNINR